MSGNRLLLNLWDVNDYITICIIIILNNIFGVRDIYIFVYKHNSLVLNDLFSFILSFCDDPSAAYYLAG